MSNIPFRPVRGTEESIKNLTTIDGYLYMATDTGKTYLGTSSGKVLMGQDIGVFYGTVRKLPVVNTGVEAPKEVVFQKTEIEGSRIPSINDLILNVDGCFYRVKEVKLNTIIADRLTLQGSGGGGGGGDNPSSGDNYNLSMSNTSYVFAKDGQDLIVDFTAYYRGTDDNFISSISLAFIKDEIIQKPFGSLTTIKGQAITFNKKHELQLNEYKHLFSEQEQEIAIIAKDKYGLERSVSFKIRLVKIELITDVKPIFKVANDTYSYFAVINGATAGVSNKKITYRVVDEENIDIIPPQSFEYSDITENSSTKTLNFSGLSHGAYTLKVQASARIAGTTTVIYSNEIIHKFGYYSTKIGTPILLALPPEKTPQYINIPIYYMYITEEDNKSYSMQIKINGNDHKTISIKSNIYEAYNLSFDSQGTKIVSFTIMQSGIVTEMTLNITPYDGNLPVLDPSRGEVLFYLTPKGRSNQDSDRNTWTDYSGQYSATLNNVNFGSNSGWLMEQDGTPYLQLSSGANLTFNDFEPFAVDYTNAAGGHRGLTIELDIEINGITDYSASLIKCMSLKADGTRKCGFQIYGNTAELFNDRLNNQTIIDEETEKTQALSEQTLVEGKRVCLSYVIEPKKECPMCYTYLNGVLSEAVIYAPGTEENSYSDGDTFIQNEIDPAHLTISSTGAQLKIYGIRFYNRAMDDQFILKNYLASIADLNERQRIYEENNIFLSSGKINADLVMSDSFRNKIQIPYMILTGGRPTQELSKWEFDNSTSRVPGLPVGKKDYHLVDVEVKYPKTGYFTNYKDYSFKNVFKDGKNMWETSASKASNGGAIMYAQGTSSMEYPIKNLRLRFNKIKGDPNPKQNFFTVRPDIAPVEIICMKADYMESSGSHNTGTANFVDKLYESINIQTPGQEHFTGDKKIVTCIKGHPCLIFYSQTGEEGSYEYIGKYNLNLDKATPEPFGFNHDDNFGYLNAGDEYYQITYYDKDDPTVDPFIGAFEPDEGGDVYPDAAEVKATVQEGEKVNSIHCFEFLDNGVQVCNFLVNPDPNIHGTVATNYYDTWYGMYRNKENDIVPGWALGFESRYPEDRLGYHDADSLYPLASWLNSLYELRVQEEADGKTPNDITIEYAYDKATIFEQKTHYYIQNENGEWEEVLIETVEQFDPEKHYTRRVVSSSFDMISLERFKNEYQCHFDKDFLLTYYLVTEALLMADSRVKNMMIATWGKEEREYKDLNGNKQTSNNYIFYPIFYDMDTMLGLDNTGVNRFNYYDEDTDPSLYNGDEVLWNFVRDALKQELLEHYQRLENAQLSAKDMLPYYNNNQAEMANEAFYIGDARYKYIDPARNGYIDHLHNTEIPPGKGPYLYALQGNRSLMREEFLTNRMQFLQGKYNSSNFQNSQRVDFRWYYHKENDNIDEKLKKSIIAVKPDGEFTLTSAKTGYAGVLLGANGSIISDRFDGAQTKSLNLLSASSANGTEAYILGLHCLSDLGDLSNKYPQKFIIKREVGSDLRLKTLTLGNPHKDYYNPYWAVSGAEIGLSGCKYLEEFNLQNCSSFTGGINFGECSSIQRIYLTGSGVTAITLPANSSISELRLPTSIKKLILKNYQNLNDNTFSLGIWNYGTSEKIGEAGGHYENDYSKLETIEIVNTPVNSYQMVTEATRTSMLEQYHLENINWNINSVEADQYCKRTRAEIADENGNLNKEGYYIYNMENKNYIPYTETVYPTSGILFEKVSMLEGNEIVCIPILEKLKTLNYTNSVNSYAEALTGTITIDCNNNGTKLSVDEMELYNKYASVFPKLTINYNRQNIDVNAAHRIQFYFTDRADIGTTPIDNIDIHHLVLTQGDKTLSNLLKDTNFRNPNKSQTQSKQYYFTGCWQDYETDQYYYQDNINVESQPYWSAQQDEFTVLPNNYFSNYEPETAMKLLPIYKEVDRQYTIKLWDSDGSKILEKSLPYGSNIGEELADNSKSYYMYKAPTNDLGVDQRYAFKGWQTQSDYMNNVDAATYTSLTERSVVTNEDFYAYYTVENCKTTPSMISNITDFFTFTPVGDYYTIALKEKYKLLLQGKITLPSEVQLDKDVTPKPIKEIKNGGFENSLITHVYFLENASYKKVNNAAFMNAQHLEEIYLPNTIEVISDYAFQSCSLLRKIHDENTVLSNLSQMGNASFSGCQNLELNLDTLVSLNSCGGSSAFYNCKKITCTQLPLVQTYPAWTFNGCEGVNISIFGSATNQIRSISGGGNVFNNAGNNSVSSMTLYCNSSKCIEADAFKGYQVNISELNIYTPSGVNIDGPIIATWGLNLTTDCNTIIHTINTK